MIRLLAVPPSPQYNWCKNKMYPPLPVQVGDIATIYMRRKIDEISVPRELYLPLYTERVLELRWQCPHCRHDHTLYVPEGWIAEGKVKFVEQDKGE